MATIKITLFASATNAKHEMQVPDTITGRALIEAMLKNGKLSRTDSHGQETDHQIIAGKKGQSGGTRILDKSLCDAGVKDGDQLIIKTEIIAAGIL